MLSYGQVDEVFPMLYIANYNELEPNVIKLSFGHFFAYFIQVPKKRPNNNLPTLACAIALVHYS